MELFLLLSIGLSIVAFISIALNQRPPLPAASDQKIEPAFPLESFLLASESMSILKIEDQIVPQNIELFKEQQRLIKVAESTLLQEEAF